MNGAYYDVYDIDKVPVNIDYENEKCAIIDRDGVVLPIRKNSSRGPGYYKTGFCLDNGQEVFFKVNPTQEEIESTYNDKTNYIDFSKTSNLIDYMVNIDKERSLTENIVSNVENEYRPNIKDSDDPFMKLVKTAIQQKKFDISKYKPIFGSNFNNDKRSLESKSITLNKAVEILTKLDVEIKITLQDRGDNVPNPMRKPVSAIINGLNDFHIDIGVPDIETYNNEEFSNNRVDLDEEDWDGEE